MKLETGKNLGIEKSGSERLRLNPSRTERRGRLPMQKRGRAVVVLQPMFMPWVGVFEQIRLSDVFVHYDDVQLPQGRHFTNRVQVKTPDGTSWLTVPLVHASRGLIRDVRMQSSSGWREQHRQTFRQLLGQSTHFEMASSIIEEVYAARTDLLADFNINAIETISANMGLQRTFLRSSELDVNGRSSSKLLAIVKELGGDTYITGHGARNYLDHRIFEDAGISVRYMDYRILPYAQRFGAFTPFVSVLDLIANCGEEFGEYCRSETTPWSEFPPQEDGVSR